MDCLSASAMNGSHESGINTSATREEDGEDGKDGEEEKEEEEGKNRRVVPQLVFMAVIFFFRPPAPPPPLLRLHLLQGRGIVPTSSASTN